MSSFLCEFLADVVTRAKRRKSLTEGVTFRRVRRLEIHCKVRADEDVSLMPMFSFCLSSILGFITLGPFHCA